MRGGEPERRSVGEGGRPRGARWQGAGKPSEELGFGAAEESGKGWILFGANQY